LDLSQINLKIKYRSFEDNISESFLIPALSCSEIYKRAVGFFSSSSLIEASKGISGLINNGGLMQLITSPRLSDEDIEAIYKGYNDRDTIITKNIMSELNEELSDNEKDRLSLLSVLISNKKLDIKIAITEKMNTIGMYHEKIGIIKDSKKNTIAFTGSLNESHNSFINNFESIDVFCSWREEDKERVIEKNRDFDNLWNNTTKGAIVFNIPDIAIEKIKSFKPCKPYDEIDKTIILQDKNNLSYMPQINNSIKLFDYQEKAIQSWEDNNYLGIYDMATGTGKTITALASIARICDKLKNKLFVVILCPYQHLVEQWLEDLINFNIKPIVGYSRSSQKDWKDRLRNAILDQNLKVKNSSFVCFISTNATFQGKYVQDSIMKIKSDILIVVDEAHNVGSERLRKFLSIIYKYRLGLSATIERHNDDEGTESILDFFGKRCIQYDIDKAISENKLAKYKYYPIVINLTDQELEKYTNLTNEISKCVIYNNKKKFLSKKGEMLALERARLIAGARNKILKLEEYIKPYKNKSHILVYCGTSKLTEDEDDIYDDSPDEIRQIDLVTDLLGNKLGMKVAQFTSKEDILRRQIIKDEFTKGTDLQALIAIKCLDEGVNIPLIKTAFILASTTNPKEYIQRRGRVLRLAPGKEFAEIYDFITITRPLNSVQSQILEKIRSESKLVKNELARAGEFARTSMNRAEAEVIIDNIKKTYLIDQMYFKEDYFD